MDEKNIEVKIANGRLTIKGEKQEEKEEERQDYYVRERSFGSFERTFPVPDGVELDKVDASFKKGVLTVTLKNSRSAEGGKEDHSEGWLIFLLHRRTKPRRRFRNEQRGYLDVRSDLAVPRCVLFM
jgi:HSP20 family protein